MILSSILLFVTTGVPTVEAKDGAKMTVKFKPEKARRVFGASGGSTLVVTTNNDGTIAIVEADVSSDSGGESVTLDEADAWMHGSTAISALPTEDASVTLTLYNADSAKLKSFSGTLATDGSVAFTADDADEASCEKRGGCSDSESADLEVLAAEVFVNGSGYDLSFDLNGADTYNIAYADVRITQPCDFTAEKGVCLFDGKTALEVGWDSLGSVWESELSLEHAGETEVDTVLYDSAGKKIDKSTASLGQPVSDGGSGVNAVGSSMALVISRNNRGYGPGKYGMELGLVSPGWTAGTAPTTATVALEDGETLTIPANSYQVTAATTVVFSGSPEKEAFQVSIDGTTVKEGVDWGDTGFCANGTCVALTTDDAGTWSLSASAYAASASKLPSSVKIALTSTLKAAEAKETSYTLTYSSEVTAVFAHSFALSADPIGLDVAGNVSVLGAADKKGKQKTLAKDEFVGSFTRNDEGNLVLAGLDDKAAAPRGDILIGGAPIDFELTDVDKDGYVDAPPVVMRSGGFGNGYQGSTTQTQQAQLL